MLDSRHAFQRSSLTDAQRLTYDVVEDYLEFTRLTDDYYYLDNSCRGSFTGFWAQLPILLNEFKFNRRSDLDSCFHIPETAEETFLGYAEIERERLENGAGLSQVTLDDIIAHEGYPGHISISALSSCPRSAISRRITGIRRAGPPTRRIFPRAMRRSKTSSRSFIRSASRSGKCTSAFWTSASIAAA